MGTSVVKRYVFAPMEPCFAYTLEEVPYRRNTTLMLDGMCKYMLTGLAKSVTYDLKYEQGRVHRMHITWRLTLDPEQDQAQHNYALSHFYRKLGWLETKNFNDSWRLFDMRTLVSSSTVSQNLLFKVYDASLRYIQYQSGRTRADFTQPFALDQEKYPSEFLFYSKSVTHPSTEKSCRPKHSIYSAHKSLAWARFRAHSTEHFA